MSQDLPKGWAEAPLSKLGTWLGGGTPSKAVAEYWENGTIHWVSPKDMKRLLIDSAQDQITVKAVKESATNIVPERSVLMVTRSGILEHSFPVAVNTVPVAINQDLKAWTPCAGVDSAYAAYYLQSRAQHILEECSKDGTTVSSIDFVRLNAYPISVAPAPEQARIVSKVEELFSEVEEGERALERVQKLVERYRQSVLKAAVTGELTREWREKHKDPLESGEALLQRMLKARREAWDRAEQVKMRRGDGLLKRRYQEPTAPTMTSLATLPTGWACASGAQLFEWSSGDFLPAKAMRPGMVPVYGGNGVNGHHDESNVDGRTVVIGRVGVHCGNVHFVSGRTWITDNAIYATQTPPLASLEFLVLCLRAARLGDRSQGGAQPFVNQKALNEAALPVPPIDEQQRIVDLVAVEQARLDAVVSSMAVEMQRSAGLRQAVLKLAFSGFLVPQSRSDEPASTLLDRLRDLRAAEQELTRVRSGRSKTQPLAQVMKEHGMQSQAKRRTRTPRGV